MLLLPPGTTPGRGKRLDSIANTWSSISRKIDFIQSDLKADRRRKFYVSDFQIWKIEGPAKLL